METREGGSGWTWTLLSEVLFIGVLVCLAALPLVTALAAVAAGSTLLHDLIRQDSTPTVRRFVSLLRAAVRGARGRRPDAVVLLAPVAVTVVSTVDTLALLAGLPGRTVLGPAVGLVLVLAVVAGLRAAAMWGRRPHTGWATLLADAARAGLRDYPGSLMLATALLVAVLIASQLPAFLLALPGLLVLAATTVQLRTRPG